MTRSSDLVMVEREVLENINALLDAIWSTDDRAEEIDGLIKIKAIIRSALQSVEGGVQVAAKQESCPVSAPHTETATVTALRECQRVLAMMIDPASIRTTSSMQAWAAAVQTETKARRLLDKYTRQDESRAKATEGKAGMAVGTPHVRLTTAGSGLRVGAADAVQPATSEIMDVTAGETAPICPRCDKPLQIVHACWHCDDCSESFGFAAPGPSDAQLTKTPAADHDAGNLPDDPDMPSLRLCSFNYLADELRRRGATVTPAPHGGDFANG